MVRGLKSPGGDQRGALRASKSAISQARTRLGFTVMEQPAQRVLRPLALPNALCAAYRAGRLMDVDGTCIDVAVEAVNVPHFGDPAASRGQCAFRQARVSRLLACGPLAVVDAASRCRPALLRVRSCVVPFSHCGLLGYDDPG